MESAKVIQIIKTNSTKGTGKCNDPIRRIVQYWTLDGKFLFEKDNEVYN